MRYPIIADFAVAAVIFLCAYIRGKKGLFHSALKAVVLILSIAIAIVGSSVLTPKVTEKMWPAVMNKIEQKVDEEAVEIVKGLLDETKKLDGFWQVIVENLSYVGIDIDAIKASPDADAALDNAANNSDYMTVFKDNIKLQAEFILSKIVNVVLWIALFIASLLILGLIRKLIGTHMTEVPVLGWFDKLLGFLFGLIQGFVLVFVVVRACNLLHIDFFKQYAEGTTLLNWFIGGTLQESIAVIKGIDLTQIDIKVLNFNEIVEAVKGLFGAK